MKLLLFLIKIGYSVDEWMNFINMEEAGLNGGRIRESKLVGVV